MPNDPYAKLEQACSQIARRRPSWPRQLGIAGIATVEDVVDAIRQDKPSPTRSDDLIRAMAKRASESDVATVLLHALAGPLRARLGRTVTDEYRADALGDLTFVVFDATERNELERCTRLAHRFANRAHNRTHKRTRRVTERGVQATTTIEPLPPDRITLLAAAPTYGNDEVADTAAVRVDLHHFATAIELAISTGDLDQHVWLDVRDNRLRGLFAESRPRTNRDRATTSAHGRVIKAIAFDSLAVA